MSRHAKLDETINITFKIQTFGPDPNSAYFKISCNPSYVATRTERMDDYESTTETGIDKTTDPYQWLQVGSNRFEGLQTQFEQLQNTQDNFQSDIPKLYTSDFLKLTDELHE